MATILIASSKVPKKGKEKTMVAELRRLAESMECQLIAVLGKKGPGCYNYGLKVEGERWEEFAQTVSGILMPARWTLTTDDFGGFLLEDLE